MFIGGRGEFQKFMQLFKAQSACERVIGGIFQHSGKAFVLVMSYKIEHQIEMNANI